MHDTIPLTSVENIVRNQKSLEFSRLASNWNESHSGSWARAKELNGLVIFPFTTMNICMVATENLDLNNGKPYLFVIDDIWNINNVQIVIKLIN